MSKLLSDLIHKGIRPVVQRPTVDGRVFITPEDSSDESSEDETHKDYAQEYIEQEMKLYSETYQDDSEANSEGISIDGIVTELAASDIRSEVYRMATVPEIFSKYNFEVTVPTKGLTIHNFKNKIISVIKTNSVLVIHGPTGCGKTTQVPQYILDDCRIQQKPCRIIVTQPRKIAAINVAKRVCQERGWPLGSVCGYQIGLEKQVGPDVVLTYVTTGILLQKLIHSKSLDSYTHIIIDEIHERNQDMDFLLLVIRKLLFTKSFQTKVILMSATIEAKEFSHYFRSRFKGTDMPAPIVHITEPNNFIVTNYYLEHLPKIKPSPVFDKNKPELHESVLQTFLFLINVFDKLDEDDEETKNRPTLGSVLVFLPGIREIEDVEKLLIENQTTNNTGMKFQIIPLHSSLPNDEQARAFKPVERPLRKVILSTNIAESSITVPDVSFVIDFCLTKNLVVDKVSKFQSLQLEWASHVNCEQRAGRAGRVSNGRVYRLLPKEFYEMLDEKGTPEILRAPLENLVLHAKILQFSEEPKSLLALAINPPNLSNIESTIWHLKEIGGLLPTCRGRKNISDGDLTFLGEVMSGLPLDVCLSKLIVLGHMYSVLNEAIIMAAGCSIQNIFATPFAQRFQAYNKKLVWSDGSCSDLVALLNLYNVWQACKRENLFKRPYEEFTWCKNNLVNLKGLREWHTLITELTLRLKRFGIEETSGNSRVNLTFQERSTTLKIIICGAFYPNYFIRSAQYGQVNEKDAVKTVSGRDPYKTAYLTGIEPGQPAVLYAKEIRKKLDLPEDTSVQLDGTGKVYLEFKDYKELQTVNVDGKQFITTIPGKIAMPVYHAVKKRQMKVPIVLKVLPGSLAWDHVQSLERKQIGNSAPSSSSSDTDDISDTYNCFSDTEYDPIPSLDTQYMTVVITHRIDAGHFFCQNIDNTSSYIHDINRMINATPLTNINVKNVKLDRLYACKYLVDGQYYRAKIQVKLSDKEVQVLFVDYGNIQNVKLQQLCELPDHPSLRIPHLAIECVLSEVEPAYDVHRKGIWSEQVNKIFDNQTENTILYGKVYSVCDDIVHMELYKNMPNAQNNKLLSINQWLIQQGYARRVEESFRSKQDHEMRKYVMSSSNPPGEAKKLSTKQRQEKFADIEASMKGVEKFAKEVVLKGPFSPLEMKIVGTLAHGSNKSVDVEPSSVNSVLLDSDPLDPHTRLIVAASINQTPSGDRLILRQTTVMPNIPGFPFLMALSFCPEMEPKLNDDGTTLSAILCGLGVHENSIRACFPSHDIVLTLDVEINETIINAINELRYSMNTALNCMSSIHLSEGKIDLIEPFQRTVKLKVFQLMTMKMTSIKPFYNKNASMWKNYPLDTEILCPPSPQIGAPWPLHWFFKMRNMDEKPSQLQANMQELRDIAKKLVPFEEVRCEICGKDLLTLGGVRNHLISPEHKKKEAEVRTELGIL